MGRQLRLFCVGDDYHGIGQIFRECGFGVAFPYLHQTSQLVVQSSVELVGWDSYRVYLARSEDVSRLPPLRLLPSGLYAMSDMQAQVVEFDRPVQTGSLLRRGRIYAATGYFDAAGVWISREAAFLSALDRSFRALRKAMKHDRHFDAYVADHALELHSRGDLTFIP